MVADMVAMRAVRRTPTSDKVTSMAVAPPITPAVTCPEAAKPRRGTPTAIAVRTVTASASGAEPTWKSFAYHALRIRMPHAGTGRRTETLPDRWQSTGVTVHTVWSPALRFHIFLFMTRGYRCSHLLLAFSVW